MESVKETIKMA